MPAVQGSDTANETVVQCCVFRIAVLPALYRLMVRRAVCVRTDLPTIAAKIVVILQADLFIHKTETAHNAPANSSFKRRVYAGLIIDHTDAPVRKIFRCLPDSGIVIRRAREYLFKGEVHAFPISALQGQRISQWIHHAERLRQIRKILLRQFHRSRHRLLQACVTLEGNRCGCRKPVEIKTVSCIRRLCQKLLDILI